MKAMKKKMYVSPETEMKLVELEKGFMSGSADIQNPGNESGKIEQHEVNSDFGFNFTDQNWDNTEQTTF